MISPVDLTVVRWLTRRDSASVPEIVAACAMPPGEVRVHLASLAGLHFVASRLDKAEAPPCLVYFVNDEGRLAAGIGDATMHNGGRGDPVTTAGQAIRP